MKLLAYAWVVWGMVLVVSPYRFRQLVAYMTGERGRFQRGNLLGLIVGVVLLTLGLTAY